MNKFQRQFVNLGSISYVDIWSIFGQQQQRLCINICQRRLQWTEATVTYGRALLSRVASDCEQVHDTIGLDNKNFFQ